MNILGRVAFTGDRFDDDFNQIFSVNTSRGGPVTTVAESRPGGIASFQEPSLNDLGERRVHRGRAAGSEGLHHGSGRVHRTRSGG